MEEQTGERTMVRGQVTKAPHKDIKLNFADRLKDSATFLLLKLLWG